MEVCSREEEWNTNFLNMTKGTYRFRVWWKLLLSNNWNWDAKLIRYYIRMKRHDGFKTSGNTRKNAGKYMIIRWYFINIKILIYFNYVFRLKKLQTGTCDLMTLNYSCFKISLSIIDSWNRFEEMEENYVNIRSLL